METNDKAQWHISALSMQIAAQSFCGITDLQKLTELRKSADEILDAINDSMYTDDSTDSLEHGKHVFLFEKCFWLVKILIKI